MISNSAATHAKVAIYIRVSTLHQIDRDSLPMQRQDLIAYAKLILNTDDVTIFEDAGYSGKNTIRPEFQKMMSQLRTGTYTHLLVWKIDRISRNLLDFAEMYQELKDLGVTFVSKNEQFDTSTAMGEAMLKIILVFAELERNMTSERVTATMISRASNGQWNGGRIPYGYDYDPEEQDFSFNSDEYNIAHLIHDKYEELRSLVYLARYLNEHGYRTRAGNDWSPVSLDIILRSVFYCGDYQYNRLKEGDRQRPKDKSEWITVKDHHPAIVSREQKERILALLESNRRLKSFRKSGKSKYTHIFSGLLICGNCGQPMTSSISTIKKTTGRRYSLYFCPTHRKSKLWCTENLPQTQSLASSSSTTFSICSTLKRRSLRKRAYRNWNSSYSPAILSPRWPPLPRTDYMICFIRSAPALSKARSSEKMSKSKRTPSRRCNYQSSKRKKSVWRELLTV